MPSRQCPEILRVCGGWLYHESRLLYDSVHPTFVCLHPRDLGVIAPPGFRFLQVYPPEALEQTHKRTWPSWLFNLDRRT